MLPRAAERRIFFMKKNIIALLAAGASVFTVSGAVYAQINVTIDGVPFQSESEPVIENDSTLVPMRDVFEALGAEVQWVESKRAVNAYKGANTMTVTIDSATMTANGEEIELAAPAKIINDKTYVPLRAVSENFNAEVEWDGETRSVTITTPQYDHKSVTKKITDEIKADDGTTLVSMAYTYPEFENPENDDAISSLNLYVKVKSEDLLKLSGNYKEYALEKRQYCEEQNIEFEPVFVYSGYDVTYDFFNRISLFEQTVLSEADDIQGVSVSSCNYDLADNRMLEKEDILNITESDFKQISMYDFYLFENNIILYLNADNMYYYQLGYAPSMSLAFNEDTMEFFKINPANGEDTGVTEPKSIFEDAGLEPDTNTESVICVNEDELANRAGFKPAKLSNGEIYTPVSYEAVNTQDGVNCVITYTDLDGKKSVVQKAEGDFMNIDKDVTAPINEKLIGNSMVQFFSDDDSCYACFSIEKSNGSCYSYSIEFESGEMSELMTACTDIITKEQILN